MTTLRNYEQESKQCELYSLMYKNQDLKFVFHQKGKYEKLNNKVMNIHKALSLMDTSLLNSSSSKSILSFFPGILASIELSTNSLIASLKLYPTCPKCPYIFVSGTALNFSIFIFVFIFYTPSALI